MVPLSKRIIARIEDLLEPGYFIQLEQVGNNVLVHKRPRKQGELHCPPAQVTRDERATLQVLVQVTGEDPISLASWPIKNNFWLLGVITSETPPSNNTREE